MLPICTATSKAASSALLMVSVGPLPPGSIVMARITIASACGGGKNASTYNLLFAGLTWHGAIVGVCDRFPILYVGNMRLVDL